MTSFVLKAWLFFSVVRAGKNFETVFSIFWGTSRIIYTQNKHKNSILVKILGKFFVLSQATKNAVSGAAGIASASLVSWQRERGVPCASEREAELRTALVGG